jgi:hypothetical protein
VKDFCPVLFLQLLKSVHQPPALRLDFFLSASNFLDFSRLSLLLLALQIKN